MLRAIPQRSRAILPTKSLIAFVVALFIISLITALAYRSLQARDDAKQAVGRSIAIRERLDNVMLHLLEAQSAMRGYILTGDPGQLRGADIGAAALPVQLDQLRTLLADQPEELDDLAVLDSLARARLAAIAESIELKRQGDGTAVLERLERDRAHALTDQIRQRTTELRERDDMRLRESAKRWEDRVQQSSYAVFGGAGLLTGLLFLFGWAASRNHSHVEERWVRRLRLELGDKMQADYRLESLGDKILGVLVPNLNAQIGSMWVTEVAGLRRVAGHALPSNAPAHLERGQGLVGQAAVEARVIHLQDVPDGYLTVASSVGRSTPRQVVIVPASIDGHVQAVLELGFLREVSPLEVSALSRVAESISGAVRASRDRGRLEELLEETRRQAEKLRAQQEELRVTNEELGRAGAELQRANEYKSKFLASMSHELRTPLNSTLVLAKLLAGNRDGNLTAEQVKYADTIYSAGKDLLTLIDEILDFSKIEAHKIEGHQIEVDHEPIMLASFVSDLRNTFTPLAEQKQLVLEVTVGGDVPESIDSDPMRLQLILRNLLSNAVKFTERGGVYLDVGSSGDHVRFVVRDTGIGIAQDQQELVFEPFRQADSTSTRKFGGTGLGLTIARDLSQLLGGELHLDSAPGRGSTFTLTLPTCSARAAAQQPVELEPLPHHPLMLRAADDREPTFEGKRILIVEDDVRSVFALSALLEAKGAIIEIARNGREALDHLRGHPGVDLVLMDIMMPEMDGLEATRELRKDASFANIPIIALTAKCMADDRAQCREAGANHYLAKPLDAERLLSLARMLIHKSVQPEQRS